ncbi:hypothetical protein NQ317_013789 [Molorchus minor]|uniref:Flavoprotein domain-containing protein n=1 Tax=Molorchus minor TaxID=1323400 RepID=A0ABQ9JE08_9CUCU|nr:hypothetical protein NQ317_013789 [Molorchus minor]
MVRILIGCTGSVATIKLPQLINGLLNLDDVNVEVRICVTEHSKHFYNEIDIPENINIFSDTDEWAAWSNRGDPVLHIELAKWADIFLIAPLDANTLAKISNGICDNLLTCTARAWDVSKPLIFCPAMNTKMYEHPLTYTQVTCLKSWGYIEIPVIEKVLICGDTGPGAMAEVTSIVAFLKDLIINKGK